MSQPPCPADLPATPDAAAADGVSRREILGISAAATALPLLGATPPPAPRPPLRAGEVPVSLRVNGTERTVAVEPRVTLLDALREDLHLTGTKLGCDHGQCGACTVLVDGRRVLSCLTLAVMHDGQAVTTVEGLARGEVLHPVQAAFIACDALQCGFCTPGQVVSAACLVDGSEPCGPTDDDVRAAMSGNLCRCGAYPNIVRAVQAARHEAGKSGGPSGGKNGPV